MPRKASCKEPEQQATERNRKARHAFEAVVESIHDDHKMLEGEELWRAVVEIFGITRPETAKEPK